MTKVNLREERENRNITIQQVSSRAKIPAQFIEALETGIVPQKLRGPILLSYKKKYLKFLGLPVDSKLRFKTKNRRLPPSSKSRYRTRTILTTTTNGIKQPSTLKSMAIGFSIAVVCIASLKLISTILDGKTSPNQVTVTKVKSGIAVVEKEERMPVKSNWLESLFQTTVTDANAAEKPRNNNEIALEPEGGKLSLTAKEETKVRMYCDSSLQYSGFLKKGKDHAQLCNFDQKASIWVQDVSRVKIAFNNRFVRPMGPQDTARTLNFSR